MARSEFKICTWFRVGRNLKVSVHLNSLAEKNHRAGIFFLVAVISLFLIGTAWAISTMMGTLTALMKNIGVQVRADAG